MVSNHLHNILHILILITISCQHAIALHLECEWRIPFLCSAESYKTDFSNTTELTIKKVIFVELAGNTITFETVDEFRTTFAHVQDVTILNATEVLVYTNTFLLFQHVPNIHLTWSSIQTLNKFIWIDGNTLKTIDLSFGKLSVIIDNTFSHCQVMRTLYLNNNFLTLIRDKTFAKLPSIEDIFLNENLIEMIEPNAFNIPTLERLYLQNNRLVVLPDGLFESAPKYLDLSSNQLKHIGRAFDDAIKLTSLIMNNNTNLHKVNLNALSELYNLNEISLNGTGYYFQKRLASHVYYGTVKRRHSNVKHLNLFSNYTMLNSKDYFNDLLNGLSTVFPFLESLQMNVNMTDEQKAGYFPKMSNTTVNVYYTYK